MCMSMSLKTKDFYFGRNMDLDYKFGERVVITPRNYKFKFKKEESMDSHFAIIGMASIVDNYPLYAEGVNEKGLGMAGLNFPDNAFYTEKVDEEKANITPFEIIPWVLGKCENVDQTIELLNKTNIVAVPFSENLPLATLHWHIADREKSIVLECTKTGMHIYENPVHVLTNNPTFDFHMTNLSQYLNLNTSNPQNCFSEEVGINSFGKGAGSIGLPGDFSPASRFVKIAYLRLNSVCKDDEVSSVSQFFHLLDSVAVVNGSIMLDSGLEYMTTYSCCINATKGIYYYKTYNNNQITAIDMNKEDLNSSELIEYSLFNSQQFLYAN